MVECPFEGKVRDNLSQEAVVGENALETYKNNSP